MVSLALAMFLQFRTLSFEIKYLTACSILTLVTCVYFLTLSLFFFSVLLQRDSKHLEKDRVEKMWGALYEGMRVDNKFGKYYNLIILLRGVLLVMLVSFAEATPLLQIIPMIYFNAALVYHFFKKQTVYTDSKLNMINRVKEFLILVAEICILSLDCEVNSEKYYDLVGWIIVGSLATAIVSEFAYVLWIQIYNIKTIIINFIDLCKSIASWVRFQKSSQYKIKRTPQTKSDKKMGRLDLSHDS
jgi:hypothetical protein